MQTLWRLWQVLLDTTWIFWIGGLTFYIAIVVPVGGQVLGASEQGLVTEVVTWYANLAGFIAIGLAIVDYRSRRDNAGFALAFSAFLLQWVLMYWRYVLVMESHGNAKWPWQEWSFYSLHRVYLWTTTLLWLLAVGLTFRLSYQRSRLISQNAQHI